MTIKYTVSSCVFIDKNSLPDAAKQFTLQWTDGFGMTLTKRTELLEALEQMSLYGFNDEFSNFVLKLYDEGYRYIVIA